MTPPDNAPNVAFDATGPWPGPAMLIEASAGTGKTHTITSIVLRLIAEDGVPIDRLLVVTFTRAAAAELRDRIRQRLSRAVTTFADHLALVDGHRATNRAAIDDDVVAYLLYATETTLRTDAAERLTRLRRARRDFDSATIDTIHGFCQRMLQHAAQAFGAETATELLNDASEVVEPLVADELVRRLRHADERMITQISLAGLTPRITRLVTQLDNERHVTLWPPAADHGDLTASYQQLIADMLASWRDHGRAYCQWVAAHATAGGFGNTRTFTDSKLAELTRLLDGWAARPVSTIGLDEVADATPILKRADEENLYSKLKPDRNRNVIPADFTLVNAVASLLRPSKPLETQLAIDVAHAAAEAFAALKQQRGWWTFADLLHVIDGGLADDARRDAILSAIRSRFSVALIDEFQDTDPIQWRIFGTAFGRDAPESTAPLQLVLIGDPKQAIYRFRGADIDTYIAAARTIDPTARRTLTTNWRSDQAYLDALNHLFGHPALEADGGMFASDDIRYLDVVAADEAADSATRPVAPLQCKLISRAAVRDLVNDDVDPDKAITKSLLGTSFFRAIVEELRQFVDSGATVGRGDNAATVTFADIAVLVRKRHQADQLQQALRTAGIPSVVRSDDSVLCTAEATTVQWLIDAMLAPSDERAVRRALASDVYGYRAVALATLDDGDLDREISRFTDLRRRWDTAGFAAAFRHALGDGNTVERLVRTHRGERAVTNLLHIAEIVDHAERARRLHPEHTAMWLRRQRQQPTSRSDEHVEQRLESDGEAVQLITIHSAKGLEFPVVWVPFAWDGPARIRSDNGSVVRVGREGGTVIDVNQDPFDPDRRRHRARDTEQSWQEDLRLLYVALTRAKHQCVVHLGPVNGSEFAAISRLVHHTRLVVDDRLRQPKIAATPDPTQLGDDDWQRRLDDLVAGAPGALAWSELTPPSGANPSTEPGTADRVDSLSARTLDRDLDVAWQRTSFSALTRHGSELHEPATAAAGYDMMDTGIEPVPLARFPRGAAIGTMLHDIFEHLDFPAAADTLDAMIGRAARGHNLTAPQRQALRTGILQAVDTPLGPTVENVRLADLHADDRLNELDFDLPLAGGYTATDRTVSLHAIADVFDQYSQPGSMHADYARRLRRHGHQHVRGFLTGSIDLIARVGDSYMLADYKSNWLGHTGDDGTAISTQAHYHPTLLRDEMIVHDYVLQYHLYLVALHRYLHGRLGRDYDYDRHVAGAVYLFVRGMSPSGHGHGVFADRPPYQLVAALDDLLRQGTA